MADVKKRDLSMVPFDKLQVKDGLNIRTDMGDIEGLAASIREHGVKVPLRGYKEKGSDIHVVVDGHRRFEALQLIANSSDEIIYVPFVLEPQKYNDEQRLVDMFIMNDGKALTPLEQAAGVQRLINFGWSEKDIAAKIGKTVAYVSRLSSLSAAPKKLHKLIEKNKVSATLVMDMVAKGEADEFLAKVESGAYEQEQPSNGQEIFPDVLDQLVKTRPQKITKSDVVAPNSWKEFKKWARNANDDLMDDDKAKFFKWLCRMMNDELGENHFKSFFSRGL